MVDPNNIVVDGWDISSLNIAEAMKRARVLDPMVQENLKEKMEFLVPRPSIYDAKFIADNQSERADNIITGSKSGQVQQICKDIDDFKMKSGVDQVILMWTANTERYCEVIEGVNDTAENLKQAILKDHEEVSPSTLFAYASILKNVSNMSIL